VYVSAFVTGSTDAVKGVVPQGYVYGLPTEDALIFIGVIDPMHATGREFA
jgi:hypothetical protein